MTIQELLEFGKNELSHLDEGSLESRMLLEFTLDCDHQHLIMNQSLIIEDQQIDSYIGYVQERKSHKPIQQIMGMQGFFELVFKVTKDTLIPRQETELLVEFVLNNIEETDALLVDVGTGTGCIPISICHENQTIKAIGLDISKEALEVASYNRGMYGLEERIELIQSNLLRSLHSRYYNQIDILVSNPPYIPTRMIETLEKQVKDFEPKMALDGGDDGLDYYRLIIEDAKNYLKDQSLVVFEVGHDQSKKVIALLQEHGYEAPQVIKDLTGIERVVYATWNKTKR